MSQRKDKIQDRTTINEAIALTVESMTAAQKRKGKRNSVSTTSSDSNEDDQAPSTLEDIARMITLTRHLDARGRRNGLSEKDSMEAQLVKLVVINYLKLKNLEVLF